MQLSCSQCSGVIVPDASALRRGFATCNHCSTVLRLSAGGLVRHEGAVEVDPPEGVTIHLVALTTRDQRVQLAGPFRDVAHAIWIEEALEGRLGLLDRGVRGHQDAPEGAEALELPETCASCGAALPSASLDRRGFTVCGACDGVVLAYPPGGGPLVGEPGWQSVQVEADAERLTLTRHRGVDRFEGQLLGAVGNEVTVTGEGIVVDGRMLHTSDIERVRIVERASSVVEGIGAFARAAHQGGEANMGQLLREGERFDLVADLPSGSRPLLTGLLDPREADRLRARVVRRLTGEGSAAPS